MWADPLPSQKRGVAWHPLFIIAMVEVPLLSFLAGVWERDGAHLSQSFSLVRGCDGQPSAPALLVLCHPLTSLVCSSPRTTDTVHVMSPSGTPSSSSGVRGGDSGCQVSQLSPWLWLGVQGLDIFLALRWGWEKGKDRLPTSKSTSSF